jgi:hypothetical protein
MTAAVIHPDLQLDPILYLDAPPLAQDLLPMPVDLADFAGGNPIQAILAPATLQIIAAFGNQNLVRRAGNTLAVAVVQQVVIQTGLQDALINLVGQGAEAVTTALPGILETLSERLVEGLTIRQENMYLTNERLLMLQDPTGTQAYSLLTNGAGQTEAVPAVRLPYDEWRAIYDDLADRLNITPLQDQAYQAYPDVPSGPVSELDPIPPEMKVNDLYEAMGDEAVQEFTEVYDSQPSVVVYDPEDTVLDGSQPSMYDQPLDEFESQRQFDSLMKDVIEEYAGEALIDLDIHDDSDSS